MSTELIDTIAEDHLTLHILRRDYLVTEERSNKLSGESARHPLLGRMYLPAYRNGTERVAELRRRYQPGQLLPILYGTAGWIVRPSKLHAHNCRMRIRPSVDRLSKGSHTSLGVLGVVYL
jgi:hypothetical protein